MTKKGSKEFVRNKELGSQSPHRLPMLRPLPRGQEKHMGKEQREGPSSQTAL